jgi:hypothetical protein
MRLTMLCDIVMEKDGAPRLVRPYGTEEGTAFDTAHGTASGERLRGTVHCSNFPHRRSDGVMLPNIQGMIMTEDGAALTFTMTGRTLLTQSSTGMVGNQVLFTLFEAEDERYRWLNGVVCIAEGQIEGAGAMKMLARVFVCGNELV